MLSELVEQEKITNVDAVAIHPRASDIERLMSPRCHHHTILYTNIRLTNRNHDNQE